MVEKRLARIRRRASQLLQDSGVSPLPIQGKCGLKVKLGQRSNSVRPNLRNYKGNNFKDMLAPNSAEFTLAQESGKPRNESHSQSLHRSRSQTRSYLDSAQVKQTLCLTQRPRTPLVHETAKVANFRALLVHDTLEEQIKRAQNKKNLILPSTMFRT